MFSLSCHDKYSIFLNLGFRFTKTQMNNFIKLNPASAAKASLAIPEKLAASRKPLEDLFGRMHNYLRVSLTERCNLRCKQCILYHKNFYTV